jgi:two-component system, response regulator
MSQTLLFVDDDRNDVQLTLMGFRQERFEHEIVVAGDGKEALDRLLSDLAASRILPSLILTDLKMPRMDGLELLRRVQDDPRLRSIPVAILTSSSHEEDRTEAARLGAIEYLEKPTDLGHYSAIVGRVRELMKTTPHTSRS